MPEKSSSSSPFIERRSKIDSPAGPLFLLTYECEPLSRSGFLHAFSTRWGGVSPLPQGALNLSYDVDLKENVDENRRRFQLAANLKNRPIFCARQIHAASVTSVGKNTGSWVEPESDALFTMESGVLLGIKTADCLSILIGDPVSGASLAIHAGWRGTALEITGKALREFLTLTKTAPKNLLAALGPCACDKCYEVGPEVINSFSATDLDWKRFLNISSESPVRAHLDLREANRLQLRTAGLEPKNIFSDTHCTIHHNELFFSYRKEARANGGRVGRLLAVIGRA